MRTHTKKHTQNVYLIEALIEGVICEQENNNIYTHSIFIYTFILTQPNDWQMEEKKRVNRNHFDDFFSPSTNGVPLKCVPYAKHAYLMTQPFQ